MAGDTALIFLSTILQGMTMKFVRQGLILLGFICSLSFLVACGSASGLSIEITPVPTNTAIVSEGTADSLVPTEIPIPPKLGFISARGEDPVAMENGGRVPVSDDMVAEIFVSPYPPDWNTDLHLFLLRKSDFEPVKDVNVDLDYEMVWMDHGVDTQIGSKVADGHYLLPLSFLMYGDWNIDVRMNFADQGRKHLRLVMKFD